MDVYLGLAKHIAVRVERTTFTQVIVASAAAEHVTVDVTVVQLYMGLAGTVDTHQ